jgi:hypothetical protein
VRLQVELRITMLTDDAFPPRRAGSVRVSVATDGDEAVDLEHESRLMTALAPPILGPIDPMLRTLVEVILQREAAAGRSIVLAADAKDGSREFHRVSSSAVLSRSLERFSRDPLVTGRTLFPLSFWSVPPECAVESLDLASEGESSSVGWWRVIVEVGAVEGSATDSDLTVHCTEVDLSRLVKEIRDALEMLGVEILLTDS